MKKVKNPRFLVSAIALVTLVFLSLPAINAWADEQCILFIETDGEMRVHGYDENGTPIQIFNSEDELVWEGIIGVEPEVLTGFEPGAYMLVGPLDGRNFGAVAIVDEPIGADVDYAQAELESSFSVTEESSELKVLTVPWVATAPTIPHIAYNGHPTTFKAIARGGAGSYTYDWDFNGDDEYDYSNTTTNGYNLSAKHTYP
nr:hypothetical protein [bacterium]